MKTSELRKESKKYNKDKLREKLEEYRRGLFGFRLNAATTHIKDYSQFKKARKNIARILTLLQQKDDKKMAEN